MKGFRTAALAFLGALVLGAVVMLLTGHNPLEAYAALLEGALGGRGGANLMATLARATPTVGMGLATAVALRGGFLNLGGEGQLVLGGLASSLVALAVPAAVGPLALPIALVAGALAGGLYAVFAMFLEARYRVPILISTLLLNYPARYFASYVVTHPWRDVASGMSQTALVPEAARLPLLPGGRLHVGSVLIVVLVLLAAWILRRTRAGYELRMTGLNADFARYGGVDVGRLGYGVMWTSGALAGLVGAIEVLGVHHRFIDSALTSPLYAWTGLMAALLAGSAPLGVLVAGFLFSGLQTGGFGMERRAGVPRELAQVIQALVVLLVAAGGRLRGGAGSS